MSWKTNCSWNTKLINYIHAQWLKAHVIQSSPCVVQVDSESVVTWWMVQTAAAAAAISIALFPSIHPSIQMLPATSAASDFHPYFHLRVFKGLPQVQKKKAWFSCTWRIRLSVTVNVKQSGNGWIEILAISLHCLQTWAWFWAVETTGNPPPILSPLFSHKLLHAARTINAFHCPAFFPAS